MKHFGQWARLQPVVKMLPTRDDIGSVINPELLEVVALAIETGVQYAKQPPQWESKEPPDFCRWRKIKR